MIKNINKIAMLLSFILITNFAKAQYSFKEIQNKGTNYFAMLGESVNASASKENEMGILKQVSKANKFIVFEFVNSFKDDLMFTHKKFKVLYKGIEVQGMDFVIHEKDNKIIYINGNYENFETASAKPVINEKMAMEKAKSSFVEITKSRLGVSSIAINKGFIIATNPLNATSNYELAYKILIEPNSALGKYIFVNAVDGSIINYENLVCNTNAPGTAQTRYSGTQNFITDQQGSQYRLREVRNGVNIKTLNANYESNIEFIVNNATDFWDSNDNIWTVAEHGANQVATDGHWGSEKTFDYWLTIHNRNSINNAGMDLINYIHVGSGYNNAYWNRDKNAMFYGDGGGIFSPLTSLDVCAHELGHGICQYTSNLSYASNTESQALNEGFSDIWGASVEAWAAPTKQRWLIGEEITLVAPYYLRSMSNPPSGFGSPSSDTYGDANWNNNADGHYRSGVINKWYYLLSDGGNGTNGIGNSYSVSGISIAKAEKIAYRTEQLLNSSANYTMARTMSIQAARELYATGSCEEIAVTKAWYAVGVGADYSGIGSYTITGNDISVLHIRANTVLTQQIQILYGQYRVLVVQQFLQLPGLQPQ